MLALISLPCYRGFVFFSKQLSHAVDLLMLQIFNTDPVSVGTCGGPLGCLWQCNSDHSDTWKRTRTCHLRCPGPHIDVGYLFDIGSKFITDFQDLLKERNATFSHTI